MAKPFQEWTVLPHGRLTRLDKNLLSVTGVMHQAPLGDFDRRMTVVRLSDNRLVIYSAIALDEAEMLALESFGVPAFLIVPNDIHRMDAKIWKDRYPSLTVVTPSAARKKVEEIVNVNASTIDFQDPNVTYFTVPGTGEKEAALLVTTESGTTLVLNDLIFDLANRPGISGWFFEKIGMTGTEPHIPGIVKRREVEDEGVLRETLEGWSQLPTLRRVIISHGNIIESDPAGVLGRIASELSS